MTSFAKHMRHILRTLLQQGLLKIRFRGLAGVASDLKCHGPVVLLGREKITFGDRVSIAGFLHIWGQGRVVIGNDVLIASHVATTSVSHDPAATKFSAKNLLLPTKIRDNVWIGSHAFINAGVEIGSNSIVAAGAVLLSDVPPNSVAGGIPAKVLRHRENSGEITATVLPTSKRNVSQAPAFTAINSNLP